MSPSTDIPGSFQTLSYAQEVIFGAGSLSKLVEAVGRFGWQRLMLCTSPSQRANGRVAAVEALLGDKLAAVYDQVQPHVQDTQVDEVVALAAELATDALIGLGGGSPIGMAKAAAFALEAQRVGDGRPAKSSQPTAQPLIPVIAIPTTYAGSEMTAVCGVTHSREDPPRKVTLSDPKIAPKLVIYDPQLTLELPAGLTASTGMNALAHCLEALYSPTRNPLSTAAALSGVRHITTALPICYARGDDLAARSQMLLGANLAGFALSSVKMALHHGLCHVLGGTANVPHGLANSILLPHALRFNAPAMADLLLPAAREMDPSADVDDPEAAVEYMTQQIADQAAQMNLPQRLRDVGVKEADLPRLAQLSFENSTVQNNPRPVESAAQVEGILRAAW